jgi:hypothetical protein
VPITTRAQPFPPPQGGALKKKAADVKIGPLLKASGQHNDGDAVRVAVQVRHGGPASAEAGDSLKQLSGSSRQAPRRSGLSRPG